MKLKLRQGRRVGRTLYEQTGPEPSEDDPIIGLVDNPELAATIVDAVNTLHDRAHGGYDPRTEVNAYWGGDREALIAAWEHDQQRRTKYAEHRVTLARQAEANKWEHRLQEELEARDAERNNLAMDLDHAERDNRRLAAELAKLKR